MVSKFRRAVVTGGAGFLGSRVCRRLLEQGTAVAASDLHEPVNIGNPDEASVRQIAVRIISLAGSASSLAYVHRTQDDPMSVMPDITLARTALGFEPLIGWHQGLAETIAWLRRVLPRPAVAQPEHGPAAVASMAWRAKRMLRETSRAAAAW